MRQVQPAVGQNFLAGMVGGVQAGQQMRQANDQNALRGLLRTADVNDPAVQQQIMGLDPQMGMQLQDRTYQRGRQQKADARMDQQLAMQIEAHAAKMSAAERQQAAAEIRQGLMPFVVAHRQGAAQFEAAKTQNAAAIEAAGIDPASVTYENFPAVAAQFEGIADVFEAADAIVPEAPKDPAAIQALRIRAQEAGLQPGTPEYAQFMADGGRKNDAMRITADGQGGLTVEQGAAASGPPKMTVDAAKNTGFLIRTRDANKVLNELEDQGTRFMQQNAEAIPLGLGNYLRDQDFQRFDQARRDFVNAILRRESGAVISDQEFDNADKQYFPVPGDGPEVIAQKRRNRENAIRGLEVGSGGGAAYLDQQEPQQPAPQASEAPFGPASGQITMTPEQQSVFDRYSR